MTSITDLKYGLKKLTIELSLKKLPAIEMDNLIRKFQNASFFCRQVNFDNLIFRNI